MHPAVMSLVCGSCKRPDSVGLKSEPIQVQRWTSSATSSTFSTSSTAVHKETIARINILLCFSAFCAVDIELSGNATL